MFRNFILTSVRNLNRNRLYSLLNLVGFSVALSGIFIIITFVRNEYAVDARLPEKEITYLTTLTQRSGSSSREVGLTSLDTKNWLSQSNSEFVSSLQLRGIGEQYFSNQNIKISSSPVLTEGHFFEYFNYEMIHGDETSALENPNSIVLSETMAKMLFGDINPVGKSIEMYLDYTMPLQVTGVIEDSRDTHLRYDCLINWDSRLSEGGTMGEWYKYSIYTYVKTEEPIDAAILSNDISSRHANSFPEDNLAINFYNLSDIYFKTGHVEFMSGFRSGNEESIRILIGVAFLILVIALVNYVNINVSLVIKRLREIGVRKVLGASKAGLGVQFICESLLLAMIGTLLALTLADATINLFPGFFGDDLSMVIWSDSVNLIILLFLGLFTGVLAAMYPAIFISRISTSDGLRNQLSSKSSRNQVRNILMGVQFVITFGLILVSSVVFKQYQFISNWDPGYETEEVLLIPIGNSSVLPGRRDAFKEEILRIPEISNASIGTDGLGEGYTNNSFYVGTEEMVDVKNNGVMTTYFGVDDDFLPTYGIQLMEGRNLDASRSADSSSVVVNETLVNRLGLADPVGKRIKLFGDNSKPMTIVGVVADFNFQSLHKEVNPIAIYFNTRNYWNLAVRFNPQSTSAMLSKVESVWNDFESSVPFEYEFLNQKLARFYESEAKFNRVISLFAFLSITLSVIGLFGITAFSIEQRLKEISIRKVLGANIMELLVLFNRRVLIIFAVALIISIPVCTYFIGEWLNNFAYHISTPWLLYFFTAIGLMVILIATVSITSWKAARSNPAIYLRDE